jgi:hypothetical protein
MLTLDRLRELLHYNPETGVFTRKTGSRAFKVGEEAGYVNTDGYRRLMIEWKRYQAHRLAWLYMTGDWPTKEIDHINGDKSDNRFSNLRQASSAENSRNVKRHVDNASGFKGICFHKYSGRWMARIKTDGKCKSLGYFGTPEEAHTAYRDAALKLHREFARFE